MRALLPISDSPERKVEARRELLLRQIQPLDCFAEPVGAHSCDSLTGNDGKRGLHRHCLRQTRSVCARERSDEAIQSFFAQRDGLLRCARNDGEARICFAALAMTERVTPSLRAKRSNPLFLVARIASRSLSSGARSRDPLARNDGEVPPSLPATNAKRLRKGAQRRSNPFFLEAWIASLRSQ